jgi:imidazolonepropionase-like amidohydrolase
MSVRLRPPSIVLFLAVCLAMAAAAAPMEVGPTYAIRNAEIIPVSGPPIDKGILIIRDGLIESLGPAGKISIPEDAEIIEGEGLIAYPGLISAHTNLLLEDSNRPAAAGASAVPGLPDFLAGGGGQAQPPGNAEVIAFKLLKPKKTSFEGYLKSGFTTVLVAPNAGIFQGQSVLLNLNGENPAPMVIKNPVALHINMTTARGGYPSSLMGTIAYIRQSFLDAEHYANAAALYAKNPKGMKRPEYNSFLEALGPYLKDKRPVVFQCNDWEDIKRVLKIVDEFKLNALLTHANEAWRDADVLKKAAVLLLVTLDFRPPIGSKYVTQGEDLRKKAEAEIYPANAANLSQAGLKFALTTFGVSDPATALKNIRTAIKAGLPAEDALRALTILPAQYLGVGSQLGSLEPGKIANVILTKGELFDEKTAPVDKVFVDGVLVKF